MTLQWRVRPAEAADEAGWRRSWKGYCEYYEVSISEDVTDALWRRIMDGGAGIQAVVAEASPQRWNRSSSGSELRSSPYTWGKGAMCYLEDLFVAEQHGARAWEESLSRR